MGREAKPLTDGDALGLRFGGGQRQCESPGAQPAHHLRNARGRAVFELAYGDILLPEEPEGLLSSFLAEAAVLHERVLKRRADELQQVRSLRHRAAHGRYGIPHALQHALLGVGQGAVQVEKNVLIHVLTLLPESVSRLPAFCKGTGNFPAD